MTEKRGFLIDDTHQRALAQVLYAEDQACGRTGLPEMAPLAIEAARRTRRAERQARLEVEHLALMEFAVAEEWVTVQSLDDRRPPEAYLIRLEVDGIAAVSATGEPRLRREHLLWVHLPSTYPVTPPEVQWCQALTPLFHPQVGPDGRVALGEEAPRSLPKLVRFLADLARYRVYRLEADVRNTEAARWAAAHGHRLPL